MNAHLSDLKLIAYATSICYITHSLFAYNAVKTHWNIL